MVGDTHFKQSEILGFTVIPKSQFDPYLYEAVVTIGDPMFRQRFIENLPYSTVFTSRMHPSVIRYKRVEIGEIIHITAGTILTCNIKIGRHAHLNLHTTIRHNCVIGNYLTRLMGVNMSRNCTIRNRVYFGTNAAFLEGIYLCDNVTIGMGGIVVKDINNPGIYNVNPSRKLEKLNRSF